MAETRSERGVLSCGSMLPPGKWPGMDKATSCSLCHLSVHTCFCVCMKLIDRDSDGSLLIGKRGLRKGVHSTWKMSVAPFILYAVQCVKKYIGVGGVVCVQKF